MIRSQITNKYEIICFYRGGTLDEGDNVYGEPVKCTDETRYLGCWPNNRGGPNREVRQRITPCMTTVKKTDLCWRHANTSVKQHLVVYDATIRSNLLYGLESVALNETVKHKLDTLQLRGLHKILNIETTFADRTQDN